MKHKSCLLPPCLQVSSLPPYIIHFWILTKYKLPMSARYSIVDPSFTSLISYSTWCPVRQCCAEFLTGVSLFTRTVVLTSHPAARYQTEIEMNASNPVVYYHHAIALDPTNGGHSGTTTDLTPTPHHFHQQHAHLITTTTLLNYTTHCSFISQHACSMCSSLHVISTPRSSSAGTAFNQLAALAGDKNECCDAAYYYWRRYTWSHDSHMTEQLSSE